MIRIMSVTGLLLLFLLATTNIAQSATGAELMAAYQSMESPSLASEHVYFAKNYSLKHQDFVLQLDSAFVHFFEPIELDGEEHFWGAWVEGTGLFQFSPAPEIERNQLRLFTRSDSLNRRVFAGVLLFNDTVAIELQANLKASREFDGKVNLGALEEEMLALQDNDNKLFLFEALRNVVHPMRRAFLVASFAPEKADRLVYMFDPYLREEVRLFEDYKEFFVSLYLETICSYSVYADDTHIRSNGIARERIQPFHYRIASTIDANGDLHTASRTDVTIKLSPTQMVHVQLHGEMNVDSIRSDEGVTLPFLRYSSWENKNDSLYVFLDRAYNKGDTTAFTVYAGGDLVPAEAPVFILHGSQSWYPTYRNGQMATFDMTFDTPRDFPFFASGNKLSDTTVGQSRQTRWTVTEPQADVSFVIGEYEQYHFATDVAPIEIFVSDALHRELRQHYADELRLGDRHIERRVADDVSQSLKLFNTYFGDYDHDRLIISEALQPDPMSAAAMLHLSWRSTFFADLWGENRIQRASGVARQWWGSGVLGETYRDTWLADALADYSGLLYLQAAEGNDKFLWWLDQYREEVVSLNKLISGDEKPIPPLAVGKRAVCSETKLYANDIESVMEDPTAQIRDVQSPRTTFEIEDDAIVRRKVPTYEPGLGGQVESPTSMPQPASDARLSQTMTRRGAFVLHMLRNLLMDLQTLDDSQFYTLMKDWYVTYNGKRATTQDFRRMTEKYTGLDMGWFFDQWVYHSYIPSYEFSYEIEDEAVDGRYKASVTIKQSDVPEDFQMFVPIEIRFRGDKKYYMRLLVDRPDLTVQLPPMDQKPEKIVLNPFHSVLARVKQ